MPRIMNLEGTATQENLAEKATLHTHLETQLLIVEDTANKLILERLDREEEDRLEARRIISTIQRIHADGQEKENKMMLQTLATDLNIISSRITKYKKSKAIIILLDEVREAIKDKDANKACLNMAALMREYLCVTRDLH